MADGLNKVMLLGTLGADAEQKFGQSGTCVLTWRMACNESWYDDKAKERKERTEWVSCVLFGKRAESLARFMTKGSTFFVEGSLRTESYEKDGQKRYTTKVYVKEVIFASGNRTTSNSDAAGGEGGGGYGGSRGGGNQGGAPRGGRPAPAPGAPPDDFGYDGGDEIPF
jgi:single-strand DNA-binding protein